MRRPAEALTAALALAALAAVQAALPGAASAAATVPQVITFTSAAPTGAVVHGTPYAVTTVGGGSGNPVVISSATPTVCLVVGPVVDFVASGTCTVDAKQAGNAVYLPATASQSFPVVNGPDAIVSPNHATATAGSPFLFFLETTGAPHPSVRYGGKMPQGLRVQAHGQGFLTISGVVPTTLYGQSTGGLYNSTIIATFLDGTKRHQLRQLFTLAVDDSPVILSTTVKTAHATQAYQSVFKTSGYPAPTVTESGRLPFGVSFTDNNNNPMLSGVPNLFEAGNYPITLTASNGVGKPSVRHYLLVVRRL